MPVPMHTSLPMAIMLQRPKVFIYTFLFLLYTAYRCFYWKESLPEEWLQVSLNVGCDTLVVYLLNLVLSKIRGIQGRRILLFLIWLVLAVAGSFVLFALHYGVNTITDTWTPQYRKTFMLPAFQVFDSLVVVMIGFSLSTAYKILSDWNEANMRIERMEKDKVLSEINYLKSQLNPHFVFNTLNSIYFLIDKTNDQARNALHTFSEMLRYQLYDSSSARVSIEEELAYIENYVQLQSLRLDETYSVELNMDEDLSGFKIAPLLLIIPIENAFKYLSHSLDKNYVKISIRKVGSVFFFESVNSKERTEKKDRPGGIGLSNLRRRLELLYKDDAELSILNSEEKFELQLRINL